MSTRLGSFIERHYRPQLMSALLRVAAIGASRERSIVDDNDDLTDVRDYLPVPGPAATPARPPAVRVLREVAIRDVAPVGTALTDEGHSVAA